MKNLSNVFAGAACAADDRPSRVTQLREDWRTARMAHSELVRLGMPRVNLLITGRDEAIDTLLEALLPSLREPIGRWCPGEQLLLPPPALIGTMIFQNVGAMDHDDQRRLLGWLCGAAGRTQIVSTTPVPLYPRVETGAFMDSLFYRLNIVSIDASD